MHKQEISIQKLHFSEMTDLVYGTSQSFIFPFKNHFLDAEQLVFSWTQTTFSRRIASARGQVIFLFYLIFSTTTPEPERRLDYL